MAKEEGRIEKVRRWIFICFFMIALLLAINQIFDLKFFSGYVLIGPTFNFVIVGFFIPLVFLGRSSERAGKWIGLDIFFFVLYWALSLYLAWNGLDILTKGYGYLAPGHMVVISIIIWGLLIEAIRRSAGIVFMAVVLFFSLYPLFASRMPGFLQGVERSFEKTALFHILSTESAMGTLVDIFSNIVFGFILFGIAVVATGGDKFLLNLSKSIVGQTRGGPAKMAVVASALFGSLSGSAIANVITTGSITIPAMKSCGYRPEYAGAIETCASTGGTLTPPIMGATAFVLASFINVPYATVALGAAIPAALFYLSLFIQVDGNAAKSGLRGLRGGESLRLGEVFKDGWFYLPTLAVLVIFLFVLRWTGESAFVATVVMLGLAQIRKNTRFTLESFWRFLENGGRSSAMLLTLMTGSGVLMGSFSLTGIASTFSRELFILAGGSIPLMLLFTAVASLILGMGMTTIACYIFLALVAAPALVSAGLNELAVHLFVLYCGMLSFITPPVALCAFAAASIAETSPMKIALTACRLGGAIFVLPFFFVLNPVLVMQGEPMAIVHAVLTASLGMFLLGSAFEGYMIGVGEIQSGISNYVLRGAFAISGFLLAFPGWKTDLIGFGIALVALAATMLSRHKFLP